MSEQVGADMAPVSKKSPAEAAAILGIYESEVASVDKAAEGLVATTTDGQRYLLTPGGWEWLRVGGPKPPQLLGEAD